jgi:hypothetical protein
MTRHSNNFSRGERLGMAKYRSCRVLQNTLTMEFYTFVTQNKTGRRAVGSLLKHYNRTRNAHPDSCPVVRLKAGRFLHSDERVGWVKVPVFIVVGRRERDSGAVPDTSLAAQMDDAIPF